MEFMILNKSLKTLASKQKSGACGFFLNLMSSWNLMHICGINDNNKCNNDTNNS